MQGKGKHPLRSSAGDVGGDGRAEGMADEVEGFEAGVVGGGEDLRGQVGEGERSAMVDGATGAGIVRRDNGEPVPQHGSQSLPLRPGRGGAVHEDNTWTGAADVVLYDGVAATEADGRVSHGKSLSS